MKSSNVLRQLVSIFPTLRKDEDGHILLYFTIMLPVIVGMIGLTLDGGAFFHLNTDLHELADAAALAGAKELQGKSGDRDRATTKAETLLSNDPHWSNVASSGVQIVDPPIYYSSLNPDVVATSDTNAQYIKVTTVTRRRRPDFIPLTAALRGLSAPSNNQTSASAVAGNSSVACNVQPLMLCNPFEGTSSFTASPGQLFVFKQKGSNGSFSPGDFGLLDPPGVNSSGAKTIRNNLSQQSPNFCYVNQVSPRPGQATGDVSDGINVRFDMSPNGGSSGMDLSPAPNVIKGTMPDPTKRNAACNFGGNNYIVDNNDTAANITKYMFPGATSASTTSYAGGNLTIGNTIDTTAANAYWNYHHGANWPTVGGNPITRFTAYCREVGLGDDCKGSNTPPTWVAGTEPNAPQCLSTTSETNYKRRLISVAVVDCLANNVQGNQATNVRSNDYVVFFLTNPSPTNQPGTLNNYLGSGTNGEIIGEYVETITPGGCASNPSNPFCNGLHQVIQLYR